MNAPELAIELHEAALGSVADARTEADDLAPNCPTDRFLDRELSWLAFNNRVLDLAKDRQRVPLLERAKFLAIFASNLDEFFMVRVAGLEAPDRGRRRGADRQRPDAARRARRRSWPGPVS